MGAVIIVLAIIGLAVLFCYLKFPPPFAKPHLLGAFNKMVIAVCAFLCLIWFLYARGTWAGTAADQWWLPIGLAGALAIEICFLGLCFLLRNFWLFKPPRRPGSGMFGY